MKMDFQTDGGMSGNGAIGVIVLETDETLEPEMKSVTTHLPYPVYHSRIPFEPTVTKETLAQMLIDLPTTAALLPENAPFKSIGYGCTSGATVIGAENVAAAIHKTHPGVPVTDPITAVMAACDALGAKKVGLLTPYSQTVSAAMADLFKRNGYEIASFGCFEQEEDRVVARISENSTLEAMKQVAAAGDCDVVFASCTSLRAFNIIEEAEAALGIPVISSNSAFVWHMLRLAGETGDLPGPGRLYSV